MTKRIIQFIRDICNSTSLTRSSVSCADLINNPNNDSPLINKRQRSIIHTPKNMKTKLFLIVALSFSSFSYSAPFADYSFKSPSFNGNGYSSHVLTIENQEFTRKAQLQKDIQAALDKAKADKANTNIAKFMNNLESRIYAQISQNLATAMFANGGTNSGSMNFEGNTIFWTKDSSNVYLTVTDTVGNQTTITVPLGQFQFQ